MPLNNNILVTGGAGYIGSHTCKALARDGYIPVTYDNLSTGHKAAVRWGPLIHGDILDTEALNTAIRKYRPLAIMHFAASSLVGESVRNPEQYYNNNVVGSLSIVKSMCTNNVRHLVFSSSCAVYGNPEQIPIPDDHPVRPVNTYGNTKLAVENMLHDFSWAANLHYISLRYFNAAGADPECGIGEQHFPESHLVPLAIQAVLGETKRLEIYGDDYDTPDGSAVRDYIHVNDIADAHILALQSLLNGGDNACLNLGTGVGTSVREIIAAVEQISNRTVPVSQAPRRQGDPAMLVAKPSQRLINLGWRPVYTLHEIIKTAWMWHMAQYAGRRKKANVSTS